MDHYAPTHDLAQPWRTRTIVVSAIAAAELLALVAVGVVLLGKGWFQTERASAVSAATHHHVAAAHPATSPKASAKPHRTAPIAPARPLLTRAHTGVLVLNGNGRDGAAGAEATVLRAHGYPVNAVGNAKRNDYAASMVMFRPGYDREARRLARDLHIGVVTGLDGVLPSQLHGARLLVIVGN
jgi:hypothetical protein